MNWPEMGGQREKILESQVGPGGKEEVLVQLKHIIGIVFCAPQQVIGTNSMSDSI